MANGKWQMAIARNWKHRNPEEALTADNREIDTLKDFNCHLQWTENRKVIEMRQWPTTTHIHTHMHANTEIYAHKPRPSVKSKLLKLRWDLINAFLIAQTCTINISTHHLPAKLFFSLTQIHAVLRISHKERSLLQ